MGSLTEVQHAIVTGALLGDGSMRCKANALLEINHSASQKSYVEWKYRELADLVATPPTVRNGNGGRQACRFVTRSLPALTLAVWVMDDGSRSRMALYLNTQQFDLQSQYTLLQALYDQWGIEAALNRDKGYHRIRVSVAGTRELVRLIEPHVLPEFRYKLPQVTP